MPEECDAETYYINLSEKAYTDGEAEEIMGDTTVISEESVATGDDSTITTEDDNVIITEDDDIIIAENNDIAITEDDDIIIAEDNVNKKDIDKEFEDELDSVFDALPDNTENQSEEIIKSDEQTVEELLENETEDVSENNVDEESPLKFIALEDCDFSEFKDATFIVPINYLFFLLPYIAEYSEAKICPYVYDSQCIAPFFKQIKNRISEKLPKCLTVQEAVCLSIKKCHRLGLRLGTVW